MIIDFKNRTIELVAPTSLISIYSILKETWQDHGQRIEQDFPMVACTRFEMEFKNGWELSYGSIKYIDKGAFSYIDGNGDVYLEWSKDHHFETPETPDHFTEDMELFEI